MRIDGNAFLGDIPQERLVTLQNVENFDLTMGTGGPSYEVATHISCPSARRTSFRYKRETPNAFEGIFPSSTLLNTIVRQYATSPVEEVALETKSIGSVKCNVTFRSCDATIIKLGLEIVGEDLFGGSLTGMCNYVAMEAIRMVRSLPQLASVKRLHIYGGLSFPEDSEVMEASEFLRSMGPPDGLTLSHCSLWPHLHPFHAIPGTDDTRDPITSPPVKALTV